jgi:hypothetical protein
MKNYYLLLALFLTSLFSSAQNYELGIVHISDYDFKVVAIPDFDSAGNTDVSDVGFTLVLPAGNVNVTDVVGLLSGRPWTLYDFDAAFLTGMGLGDGTKDVYQFNLPPGQSILSHTNGQHIDLVSFSITNNPVSGDMYFLLNSDPIAEGAGHVLDSFYNVDLDGPGNNPTDDYFSAPASGLDNFMFSTLTVEEIILDDSSISVYPNPASEVINISTRNSIRNVEIFDILGKTVIRSENSEQINVSNLQAGIYLVKVFTDKGQITKKIVIE